MSILGQGPQHRLPEVPGWEMERQRIHKTATFFASRGPDFEREFRRREASNRRFSFLIGGSAAHHFQWAMECARRGMDAAAIEQEAHRIVAAGHARFGPPAGTYKLLRSDFDAFQALLSSLTGARRAIEMARAWIVERAESATHIAVLLRLHTQQSAPAARLPIVYLAHDCLIAAPPAAPPTVGLRQALALQLPAIARAACQGAAQEVVAKIRALPLAWASKNRLPDTVCRAVTDAIDANADPPTVDPPVFSHPHELVAPAPMHVPGAGGWTGGDPPAPPASALLPTPSRAPTAPTAPTVPATALLPTPGRALLPQPPRPGMPRATQPPVPAPVHAQAHHHPASSTHAAGLSVGQLIDAVHAARHRGMFRPYAPVSENEVGAVQPGGAGVEDGMRAFFAALEPVDGR